MGIKELLNELDPDFINLPDLLTQMASEGSSSEQDAAMLLDNRIRQASAKGRSAPRWYQLHPHGWETATDDTAERFLSDIAAFGYPIRDLALELEDGVLISTAPAEGDFGFLCSEIYDFLDSQGLKLSRQADASSATKPDIACSDDARLPKNASAQSANVDGGQSGFTKIMLAKHVEFISYREAITKLAEYMGDSVAVVAAVLRQHDIHRRNNAFLSRPDRLFNETTDGDAVWGLLDLTVRTGEIGEVPYLTGGGAHPDLDGWARAKFILDLSARKLPCPETLTTIDPTLVPFDTGLFQYPWAVAMRGMASFKLSEAASVLAAIDPFRREGSLRTAWGEGEIPRYKRLLASAIDAKELPTNPPESAPDDREIPHDAIRKWCRKYGYQWHIPDPNPQPATNTEALAEIERLRDEVDRLKAELTEAKEGTSFADDEHWPEELDIAMTAWRAARSGAERMAKKPGVFIRDWLEKNYGNKLMKNGNKLTRTQKERIATVANWDKTPGPR